MNIQSMIVLKIGKKIACDAVNIEGKQTVKSTEKVLYIQCKHYLP
jgi:hypothetical protein